MLELSKKSNLLEQSVYQYSLQDIDEPNLYREIYNYEEIPKIPFNHRRVPLRMPDEIWITDTTFRDGQQARTPYTVKQITDLYKMLSQLGGPKGLIRQTEFFLYGEQDRKALYACREMGLAFPEITTWIRASMKDFQLVKDMEIEETGILVSCSDYNIFKKLNMKRSQAIEYYKKTVAAALEMGIRPRCHFEDITRADYYGFVLPFISELQKMSDEAGIPIVIDAGPADPKFPLEELPEIEIFSPNETETEIFTGVKPVDEASCALAVSRLSERVKAKHYCIKLGDKGCYADGRIIPSFKTKAVDTTAAGDTFTAALTLEYLKDKDIERAAIFSCAAAAIAVGRMGASSSIPYLAEVEAFLDGRK